MRQGFKLQQARGSWLLIRTSIITNLVLWQFDNNADSALRNLLPHIHNTVVIPDRKSSNDVLTDHSPLTWLVVLVHTPLQLRVDHGLRGLQATMTTIPLEDQGLEQ
jgi:hypothetical protein